MTRNSKIGLICAAVTAVVVVAGALAFSANEPEHSNASTDPSATIASLATPNPAPVLTQQERMYLDILEVSPLTKGFFANQETALAVGYEACARLADYTYDPFASLAKDMTFEIRAEGYPVTSNQMLDVILWADHYLCQ